MTTFDTLRLDTLVTSPTNPRKNFHAGRLQELADSIAASGLHQSILVRPLPAERLADTAHFKPRPTHEVVAGERRYRASKMAGMVSVPAMIRDLTDDQVLEIQIVENIQRDSLTELETAEGYKTLMEHNGLTAEQVGQKVSKSRSSVYGSLKLLDLHPAPKEALRTERITASAALLIARIPDIKLQDKAVAYASTPDGAGDRPSYRTFSAWLQRNVMLNLSYAPFPITVATLVPAAGSCEGCKKRTDADPDLFSDISNASLCIDPPCYHAKEAAHDAQNELDDDDDPSGEDFGDGGSDLHSLASAAAWQAKADPEAALKRDIEILQNKKIAAIDERCRIACFDEIIKDIHKTNEEIACVLLAPELLRAWLLHTFEGWQDDDLADALAIPKPAAVTGDRQAREAVSNAFAEQCKLRIQRADDADIYRYTAAFMVIDDRETWKAGEPTPLFDGYAKAHEIDLAPVRQEAAEQVEDETKAELAAINQALKDLEKPAKKPAKTTSTPPPAGAAIGTGEADAKKPKPAASPAGASRKAKTTAQEAKAGIAAAMQGMEAEPLDAALGGSEAAAVQNGVLAVGVTVRVLDGKHRDRVGTLVCDDGNNKWSITLYNALGMPFVAALSTKSLEVVEL